MKIEMPEYTGKPRSRITPAEAAGISLLASTPFRNRKAVLQRIFPDKISEAASDIVTDLLRNDETELKVTQADK